MREITLLDDDFTVTLMSDRQKEQPWGLFGGGGGQTSACTLVTPEGEHQELSSKVTMTAPKGSSIILSTSGGGGYGSAFERDPEAVRKDVLHGNITIEQAKEEYGVVLNPDDYTINEYRIN